MNMSKLDARGWTWRAIHVDGKPERKCHYCGKVGHEEEVCFKKTRDEGGRQKGIVCFNCRKPGHLARRCPNNRTLLGRESRVKGNMGLYCKGSVEGRSVTQILLDTGFSRTMVRRQLVPHTKILEGKMVYIKCAHGDTVLYPLAVVDIEVEGIPVHIEAAVVDTLPVEVLLGQDVSELPRLLGKRASYGFFSQEDVMVVMTRARKKQEIQKEVLLKEEVLSGVVPKPFNTEGVTTPRPLSQEQKRCIRKDLGTKTQGEGLEYCNMDATKMKELQEKVVSLHV